MKHKIIMSSVALLLSLPLQGQVVDTANWSSYDALVNLISNTANELNQSKQDFDLAITTLNVLVDQFSQFSSSRDTFVTCATNQIESLIACNTNCSIITSNIVSQNEGSIIDVQGQIDSTISYATSVISELESSIGSLLDQVGSKNEQLATLVALNDSTVDQVFSELDEINTAYWNEYTSKVALASAVETLRNAFETFRTQDESVAGNVVNTWCPLD